MIERLRERQAELMRQPARLIAVAASAGNLLQGWDNAAIAGALLYVKPEFSMDGNPAMEGLLAASSLLGSWFSTLCSGPGADWLGRRSILCVSAFMYTLSSCIMLWSPSVAVLVMARLLVGAAIGISVSIVPIYIAEISPPEIRGQLSTFPQFMGSGGLSLSYVFCFCLSLTQAPQWRFMLALLLLPSLLFLLLGVFYLPESPRWLVSKGKMFKAKEVLRRLRNKLDVAAELALLVEGLGVTGAQSTLQEWVLEPAEDTASLKSSITSLEDLSMFWIAKSVVDDASSQSRSLSRHATGEPNGMQLQIGSLMDPMVTLIGNLRSSSVLDSSNQDEADDQKRPSQADSNNELAEDDDLFRELDDEIKAPLLDTKSIESMVDNNSSVFEGRSMSRRSSLMNIRSFYGSYQQQQRPGTGISESLFPSVGIGGGWQLAWQWEKQQGKTETGFKRVFLLQENGDQLNGSTISMPAPGESIQAAALVGHPAQSYLDVLAEEKIDAVGPAMMHPVETALKGPAWSELLEGGVRRALVVGVVLQVLQQLSGINAALYYVPQILQQSGATSELMKAGVGQNSASILGSGVVCFFMLPSIAVAMRLMDEIGRRKMLLSTLPLLLVSLLTVVVSNTILPTGSVQSSVSFLGVILYVCTFVMGFGPIPNILASEIFPTRVRGVCIGICQLAMWSCNILLTNLFPVLLLKLSVAGIFGCFAVLVSVAWIFTLLKVPETKGMPLEVIIEFFAMSASATAKPR